MRRILLAATILASPLAATAQTIDLMPAISKPSGGQLENFELSTQSPTAVPSMYRHLGMVFPQGAVASGTALKIGYGVAGLTAPLQMDERTYWPDGSVEFAELSFKTPPYRAGTHYQAFSISAGGTGGTPLTLAGITTGAITVDVTPNAGPNSGKVTHIDFAQDLAVQHPAAWRSGPVAAEARIDHPVEGPLHVQIDGSENADGTFAADVTFANDLALANDAAVKATHGNESYTATVHVGNNSYSLTIPANTPQAAFTNWHMFVPSNGSGGYNNEPAFWHGEFIPDLATWEAAGLLPQYPLTTGVYDSVIQSILPAMNSTNQAYSPCGPLFSCGLRDGMEGTGGRPDIGVLPQWDVNWIETGNQAAYTYAMQMADTSGSVPWHVEYQPDVPIAVTSGSVPGNSFPLWWNDDRCNTPGQCSTMSFTTAYANANWRRPIIGNGVTGIQAQLAHQPGLAYTAYLSTGSHYYYSEVVDQGAQAVTGTFNYNRYFSGPAGFNNYDIVFGWPVELRSGAWSLRSLWLAEQIMTASDPSRPYITTVVGDNLRWIAADAAADIPNLSHSNSVPKGEVAGFLENTSDPRNGDPWQGDYVYLTTLWISQNKAMPAFRQAAVNALTAAAPWLLNRFTAQATEPGWNPYNGATYLVGSWSDANETTPLATFTQVQAEQKTLGWDNGGFVNSAFYCNDYDTAAQAVVHQMAAIVPGPAQAASQAWIDANVSPCHNNAWVIGYGYGRGPADGS